MRALTIRLPEDQYDRPKELSKRRAMSMSRLIDETATLLLAENDIEARFALHAHRGRGKTRRGLTLLKRAAGPWRHPEPR